MSYFMKTLTGNSEKEITYNEFIRMVENGEVESVQIESDRITIKPEKRWKVLSAYTGRLR